MLLLTLITQYFVQLDTFKNVTDYLVVLLTKNECSSIVHFSKFS